MKNKKTVKLLSSSLVKLDFVLEEILLELSAISAKINSKESSNILERYENLNKDVKELRKDTEEFIKNNMKGNKIKKSKNVSLIDSVEFTQINDIDIDDKVGKLPVMAELYKNNICSVDICVVRTDFLTIKAGSIICKSDKKAVNEIESQEVRKLRQKIMSDKTYAMEMIPAGFNTFKYVLKKDINVNSTTAIFNIVYGRKLRASDNINDIKVKDKGLDIYLKTGYTY